MRNLKRAESAQRESDCVGFFIVPGELGSIFFERTRDHFYRIGRDMCIFRILRGFYITSSERGGGRYGAVLISAPFFSELSEKNYVQSLRTAARSGFGW
jgi:hypothetical protein